jgi:hypothetical protein
LRVNGPSSTTAVTSSGGDGAARDGVPDEHRRAAEVTHEGQQVAGDRRARVGGPSDAGFAAAAEVDRGHAVAGRDERGGDEAERLAAVAHAVSEHDERAGAGDVVGEGAFVEGEELGHGGLLSVRLTPLA